MAAEKTSGTTPAPGHADRYRWMDSARGLAILFVVIVHAGSVYSVHGYDLPGWVRNAGEAMAPFRMPLLIFLSGFLLDRSLKKGLGQFVYGKARNILWPYVLWTVVFAFAATNPQRLLTPGIWAGGTYLWYMLFLGCYFAVAIFVARMPYLIVAFYAFAIAMLMPDGTKYGERFFLLMGYFFCGAFAGQHLGKFTDAIANRWSLALLPLAAGLSVLSATGDPFNYSPYFALVILPAIFGLCALLYRVQDARLSRVVQFVGRKSIVYYVMHVPLYFVVIAALTRLGVTSAYAIIGTCLALGLLVPTLFAFGMDRFRAIALLFAAPDLVDFKTQPQARRFSEYLDRLRLLPPPPPRS